ncbi:hypothetical protein [Lacisediminihabitans profunda]|uniref:Oligosaccharide flippase family protein n=1 Tax=Lacisediminihabitans profunda TaxID=2594790 RepID=A0A5C8UJ10_9MICO|nr:hypothetical protein [Lacisediminihabitans profunda]TXN28221.1 hypothetical protein FVP33_17230 [Lacisediminihabitans profunda]
MSGGVYSAMTAVFALVVLPPARYGAFSILYLLFAFGISVQYSVVNEAWARMRLKAPWPAFSGALLALSVVFGCAVVVAAVSLPTLAGHWWIFALAVICALYRNGARYFSVAQGELRRALFSDVAGIVAFALSAVVSVGAGFDSLQMVAITWLASAAASCVLLRLPRLGRGGGPLSWVVSHGSQIKPLLIDSLLMDLGAIGTPFLLAGFLGTARFGVYRAVSNVALPIRLLIDPIRPALGRTPPRMLFNPRSLAAVAAATIVLAAGCFIALAWLVPLIGIRLGTLTSLEPFALQSGIFVAGSLVGTLYYIVCRTNASRSQIVSGRVVQTVLVVLMPILGFLVLGLNGAIWGFALSSLISGLVWMWLAFRAGSARRD